jgi:hypothetical protein
MFRVISPPEQILETVQMTVGERVGVEVITANNPLKLGTLSGYQTAVASFNTDIAYFDLNESGAKAFLIGPGSILDAHSDHELIRIPELQRAVDYYEELLLRLLQSSSNSSGVQAGEEEETEIGKVWKETRVSEKESTTAGQC